MATNRYDAADYGRKTEFQSYTRTLDAARSSDNPLEVKLQGQFIYLDDDSDGKVYIRFNDKNSHRFPVQAGAKYQGLIFKRVFLDWEAQAGAKVNIVYGQDANFTPTNDIQNIGQVGQLLAMPNDYYHRSVNNNEFIGSGFYGAPTNKGLVQLWNPAGSGVSLAVRSFMVNAPAVTNVVLQRHDEDYSAYASVVSTEFGNKFLGGADPKAKIWVADLAASIATTFSRVTLSGVGDWQESIKEGPIIVPEGMGVNALSSVGTVVLYGRFEWEEF